MTDYMEQDAERLIQTLESCAVDPMSNGYAEVSKRLLVAAACSLRTLLAHIQRGAVPDGWQVVPEIASDVMQRTFLAQPGTHTEFTHTALQCADFDSRYAAMLAAAPAPSCAAPAPAEVPMPEPVARMLEWRGRLTLNPPSSARTFEEFPPSEAFPANKGAYWSDGMPLVLANEVRAYGAACRAAGEAAGYARGLAEAGDRIRRGRKILDAALRGEVKP